MRQTEWLLFLVIICCTTQGVFGQDVPAPAAQEATLRDQRFAQLTQWVPEYVLRSEAEADGAEPFELIAEPILRWTNPVRQTQDGAVFLWHHRGRPAVIMCAFWRSGSDVQVMHEFQSLHVAPLTGSLAGQPVWTAQEPGVTFQPVPGSPAVAQKESLRLVQMRRIAAAYHGSTLAENQPEEQLRMLSQPLYRYGNRPGRATPGLIDGAIFALVQTTDPEILILLEARESTARDDATEVDAAGESAAGDHRGREDTSAAPRWHIAFARMSRWRLNVRHAGDLVWSRDWGAGRPDESYWVFPHLVQQPE